jgi:hypothetical protein
LCCRKHPAGDLGAHHLHARLPLPVDAEAQAERAEFILRDGTGKNFRCFRAEPLDLLAHGLIVLLVELFADCQALLANSGHSYSLNLPILYRDYSSCRKDASLCKSLQ